MLQYAYSINTVVSLFFFFFNDTATTEIYTLSLHDALPISRQICRLAARDEARHVALGMSHLLYRLQHEPGFQHQLAQAVEQRFDNLAGTSGLNEIGRASCRERV